MKLKARVLQITTAGENGREVIQLNIANWNEDLQQITTGPTDTCTIYIDRQEDKGFLQNGREYFLNFELRPLEVVDKIADRGTSIGLSKEELDQQSKDFKFIDPPTDSTKPFDIDNYLNKNKE